MATNIIGGEMQGWANVLDKQAQLQAFTDEQGRQQGFRDQGGQIMQGAIPGQGARQAQADLDAGAANRRALYNTVDATPMSFAQPYQQGTGSARDAAWASMRGAARANLGAYNDWALNNTLRSIQTQESIKRLADTAAGDAGVYPYKAYQAAHSNDDLAMIGAAIQSIGGGAANYAQFSQAPQPRQPAQPSQFYNPYVTDPSQQSYWSWDSYMNPNGVQNQNLIQPIQ